MPSDDGHQLWATPSASNDYSLIWKADVAAVQDRRHQCTRLARRDAACCCRHRTMGTTKYYQHIPHQSAAFARSRAPWLPALGHLVQDGAAKGWVGSQRRYACSERLVRPDDSLERVFAVVIVVGWLLRMVLQRGSTVRLSYHPEGGVTLDAEDLVRVLLLSDQLVQDECNKCDAQEQEQWATPHIALVYDALDLAVKHRHLLAPDSGEQVGRARHVYPFALVEKHRGRSGRLA
eukprot:CAMPEP_0185333688 /NCGR_PEP_ID=MMETSP1363-20130426/83857_1 /TAXON_ID=38817 /ORGANISM="Gephyrocapsa oceanica, Strain RCC1303" /LENGTH=233 /DNA_ID=CAMNT_0027932637 /DNA_START=45 /DNA_END=743 /DNA_ORIENTATION=+